MVKKILPLLLVAFICLFVNAQSKITPYTYSFLKNYNQSQTTERTTGSVKKSQSKLFAKVKAGNKQKTTIGAFIFLEDGASVDGIVNLGADVYSHVGNIVTAEVPVENIVTISELEEVRNIDVEKPLRLFNDESRKATGGSKIHAGTGLSQAYTGAGVVVGVCDNGIDFNHIAFKDANGTSRVKRVYMPSDYTGTRPSGTGSDGRSFSGSEYTTPEKISKLTTDDTKESHGTHTSGTAAGSYMGNSYYGYATGADLVLCGTSELTDLNIANSVLYAFNYAESVQKPVVVNLSLGGHVGAHDGTSSIVEYMDAISGEGKILSISAGNEGGDALYITKKFSGTSDALKTLLYDMEDGSRAYYGYVDAWSRTSNAIGIKAVVFNTKTSSIVYETPVFKPSANGGYIEYKSSKIPDLAKYYSGSIVFSSSVNSANNKYNSWCEFEMTIPNYNSSYSQPDYCLGLVYTGDAGTEMDAWVDDTYTEFSNQGFSGWTNGNALCSISDMATGDNIISVGAYTTKKYYKALDGNSYTYNTTPALKVGEISYFSSYGPDLAGKMKPEIVAPGAIIVSSVNGYDQSTVGSNNYNYLAAEITADGRKYQWADMMGTSMSAPAVTGIIALWLEADNTLTPAKIKEVMQKTSEKDSYVTGGNPNRWGYGKIDAYAGLVEILKGSGINGAVKEDNKVLVSNTQTGNFQIFVPEETGDITANIFSTDGMLLYTTTQSNDGTVEVNAEGKIGSGVKILQVTGNKTNYSTRIIVK